MSWRPPCGPWPTIWRQRNKDRMEPMTFLEAFKQAQRELGVPEADIEKSVQYACSLVPDCPVDAPVYEGMERDFIELLKIMDPTFEREAKRRAQNN